MNGTLDDIHNLEKAIRATRVDLLAQVEKVLAEINEWRRLGVKLKSGDIKALEAAQKKLDNRSYFSY